MWQLAHQRATLHCGPFAGLVDPAHPELGIHSLKVGQAAWPDARLLQVRVPTGASRGLQLLEAYVRGVDLVANYQPLEPSTVQPQIYWRLREEPSLGAAGVELIVSVQTSLLDSEPQTLVSTCLGEIAAVTVWQASMKSRSIAPAELPETLRAADGAIGMLACRPRTGSYLYVEMIHPADFQALTISRSPGGNIEIATEVFPEHLEKGVIRRARVCGWLLPEANWEAPAARLYESFRNESPPLTV